ncbi:hypothetical protein HYPSUDRAFT_137611 [Hypholoma sublateritium FD-334 SS-4]|uniref:V-type proton ATPase subunit G n=1 Tax=Hypholoma sublateritium (strain FD-334 SS-4) TaxID=945553 RepID=A0A0D2PVR4_HYPSF|nr:hypothetical protein HYPSUDRAFT_137611 [Hypholoma sublateritium FD-334 SS-4]
MVRPAPAPVRRQAGTDTLPVRRAQAAQQSQGIQTLLEAEKEAAKIVQQARQYRVQKLKDAHAEAAKEIDEYKKAKEQEFRAFEASHAGTTSTTQAALDKETVGKLAEIDAVFAAKKSDVVNTLLQRATQVNPQLNRNLKKVQA